MMKSPPIKEAAIIDALLNMGDAQARERLLHQAQEDPLLAARLAEWRQVLSPPVAQRRQARLARNRVAQRVGRQLDAGMAAGSRFQGRRLSDRRWFRAELFAAAACLLVALIGAGVWMELHRSPASNPLPEGFRVSEVIWQSRQGETLVVGPRRIQGPMRINKPLRLVGRVETQSENRL